MGTQGIEFLLLIGSVLLVWWTLFFVLPAIGRVHFSDHVARLRDEVDEAVITGQLPFDYNLRDWLERAQILIDDPRILGLTRVMAVHRAHAVLGVPIDSPGEEYEGLDPAQQEVMAAFDERMVRLIKTRLIIGSTFAIVFWLAALALTANAQLRRLLPSSVPLPGELASEVYRARDLHEFQLA